MVFNNCNPSISDSPNNEDDPWEMVGDEIAPTTASHDDDITNVTSVLCGAEREPSLEADAPFHTSEDEQDGNGPSGISFRTRDYEDEEDGGNNEEGDTLVEEQEPAVSPPDSLDNPAKVSDTGKETQDDSENVDEPAPPSLVTEEPDATGTPFAASAPATEGAHPLAPTPSVTEKSDSPAASPLAAAVPVAGSSENTTEEAKSESSGLVDSLSDMGFEQERIEKAIGDLREAGSGIDADSVIGEMMGETKDDTRTWDFIQSAARDFEQQHELRRRTQHCVRTVSHSAQELLSAAKEESQRFRATCRDTRDDADVRARTASAQVKHAASSAKDSLCRADEEYGLSEKVATAAVVGGALLLALGSPRAGLAAMAVAGSSVAAGGAMKHTSAHSTSTYTRDHGLREGLHLD